MIETLSRTRLKCAAQQLRLVAELKRRRARKHRFVAALYEAAARPLPKAHSLPKEGAADAEPI